MTTIPKAQYGLIGGSGTWGTAFPEDLDIEARVISSLPRIETPFGLSAPFKLIELSGQPVLRVAMHGCYPALPDKSQIIQPWVASKQVAWVFKRAGVQYVISEGSVGGIQDSKGRDLEPWTVVIPDDFYMPWLVPPVEAKGKTSQKSIYYRLGAPFCAGMRQVLIKAAQSVDRFTNILESGIYACTPLGRFETSFEINTLKRLGCTVVGQTVAHEAIALRDVGIHFGVLNIVSNLAENGTEWIGTNKGDMARFYHECPPYVAQAVISALNSIIWNALPPCQDSEYELTGLEVFPVNGA